MGALLEGPGYRHRYAILGAADVALTKVVNDGSLGPSEAALGSVSTALTEVIDESQTVTEGALNVLAQPSILNEYSLSRSLITNNPTALLHGDDWQSYTDTNDLLANGGLYHLNQDITVTRSAALVPDVLFGQVAECIHGDWSEVGSKCYDPANPPQTIHPSAVRLTRQFTRVRAAWLRVCVFFVQSDPSDPRVQQFDLSTYCLGGTNPAWKMMKFATDNNSDRFEGVENSDAHFRDYNTHGGIPDGVAGTGHQVKDSGLAWRDTKWDTMWLSGEWWEYIVFYERIASGPDTGEYRQIKQRRLISTSGATVYQPDNFTVYSGAARFHKKTSGATDTQDPCYILRLSENRNGPRPPGNLAKYRWGPYEIIDAAVLPDPYGVASFYGL